MSQTNVDSIIALGWPILTLKTLPTLSRILLPSNEVLIIGLKRYTAARVLKSTISHSGDCSTYYDIICFQVCFKAARWSLVRMDSSWSYPKLADSSPVLRLLFGLVRYDHVDIKTSWRHVLLLFIALHLDYLVPVLWRSILGGRSL